MLTSYKFKMSVVSFLSVILLCVCIVPIFVSSAHANSNEEPNWSYSDCEKVIALVENNLEKFTVEYNKTVAEENKLKATSVEYSAIINSYDNDKYLAYLDFDGDNGYAVIDGIYNVYDLQVKGDYEVLRTTQNLKFSNIDGFLTFKENTGWCKVTDKLPELFYDAPKQAYEGQYEVKISPLYRRL